MSATRPDPFLGYRFLVEVDSLVVAGFSDVTGLDVRMEPETYQEGGVNEYVHKLPTRFDHSNLVLKRGLTDPQLWRWMQSATAEPLNPDAQQTRRRTVRIFLLDTDGGPSWGWQCRSALPVRWAGPELNARDASVAVETLELAHCGLSTIQGLP